MRWVVAALLLVAACSGGGPAAAEQGADPGSGGDPGGDPGGGDPDTVSQGTLLRVDIANGDRRVVSDNNTGDGPEFKVAFALALDALRGRVLVVDEFPARGRVLAVDLATRARSVLSDDATGAGPPFGNPVSIVTDAANDRALVLDRGIDALIAVDLATGDRTVISDRATGAGPRLSPGLSVACDAAGSRAFVGLGGGDGILAVDLATGDRTVVADGATGAGPVVSNVLNLAYDPARDRLLAVLRDRTTLLAVDVATGDRADLPGIALVTLHDVAVQGDRALLVTRTSLHGLDLLTGALTLVSDDSMGSGPRFDVGWGVVFSDAVDEAYVIDSNSGGP